MLIGHSIANGCGILLAVDPQVCEIMQREERELIGVGFQTLTHPDDCNHNVAVVSDLQVGAGPSTIRKRYTRPDGSNVWADVQVSRLRDSTGAKLVGTINVIDAAPAVHGPEGLWRAAILELETVQRRRREVGNELFLDYGWLMLVQIYLAEAEGRTATIASISELAGIRPVLVTRWLEVLEQKGFVERVMQSGQLTGPGFQKVEYLLERSLHR